MVNEAVLDYEINIENIVSLPVEQYYGLRLLFLIKGTAKVTVNGRDYDMKKMMCY